MSYSLKVTFIARLICKKEILSLLPAEEFNMSATAHVGWLLPLGFSS